jgi:hypothetical protein
MREPVLNAASSERTQAPEWRRGLVCTARAGLLMPLSTAPRRVTFVTRTTVAPGTTPDYQRLHARVEAFVRARTADFCVLEERQSVAADVVARGWDSVQVRTRLMAFAALTVDFTAQHETPPAAAGMRAHDFSKPYADEMKLFQHYEGRRFDELYVDFDFARDDERAEWVLSYGEYVDRPPVDVAPFMEHAENRAAFYAALGGVESCHAAVVRRREWNVLRDIGKNVGPNSLFDITLYFA